MQSKNQLWQFLLTWTLNFLFFNTVFQDVYQLRSDQICIESNLKGLSAKMYRIATLDGCGDCDNFGWHFRSPIRSILLNFPSSIVAGIISGSILMDDISSTMILSACLYEGVWQFLLTLMDGNFGFCTRNLWY